MMMSICKIKDCNTIAKMRTFFPSKLQIWHLKSEEHVYSICDKCKDKGWKFNGVDNEYYFRPAKVVKISLKKPKRRVMHN